MTTLRQSKTKFYVLVRERGGHRSYRVVIEPAEFIAAEEEGEET